MSLLSFINKTVDVRLDHNSLRFVGKLMPSQNGYMVATHKVIVEITMPRNVVMTGGTNLTENMPVAILFC
jgi:hypothetical protein